MKIPTLQKKTPKPQQVQEPKKAAIFQDNHLQLSNGGNIWNLIIFVAFLWKMLSQKKPKKVLFSIFSFLLSNPGCVARAADWEQRKKIKKGYQQVTFFKEKRALFLDFLPCLWKRHRKKKTIAKREMDGNVDNNVCL